MARKKKEIVEEGDPGAPEWMVTFSDCMTLLLTFFVLLLSFSSFSDVSEYRKMTVSFADRFASLSDTPANRSAMLASTMLKHTSEKEQGSETRSPQDGPGKEGGVKATEQPDFHEKKVFVVASELVFWGKGPVLSAHGRTVLTDMALFLKETPNRIVISECETGGQDSGDEVGLQRAWSVVDYLSRLGIQTDRLSISSTSTIQSDGGTSTEKGRSLQIVLLERNIYR